MRPVGDAVGADLDDRAASPVERALERSGAARRASSAARSSQPYSAAACAKSSPCGVATCCSKTSASRGDRQEVEDPAAVVVDQHDRDRQVQARAASRPPMSCASATSPISSTTGPSRPPRRRTRSRPCRRSRSRRGWRAPAADRRGAAENSSTSRTGIEAATNSVASGGSAPRARRRPAARDSSSPRACRDRVRRGRVGRAPVTQPAAGRRGTSALPRGPATSTRYGALTRRPTTESGSCHASSGSKRDLSGVESREPGAQRLGGREIADAHDELRAVLGCELRIAQQQVVVGDRRRPPRARPRAGRRAAESPRAAQKSASSAPRLARSSRPATITPRPKRVAATRRRA